MLLEDLERALPIDGLLLDLHGAMVAEHAEDGDGEVLRRVRDLLGQRVPIVACLDLHANLSADMTDLADMLVIYRTYPHLDMAETGERAAAHLSGLLESGLRPHKTLRQIPFLIHSTRGCTMTDPAAAIYRRLAELERLPGVSHLSFACGFPPSDVPHCGPALVAYGPDAGRVEAAALDLYDLVLSHELDLCQ